MTILNILKKILSMFRTFLSKSSKDVILIHSWEFNFELTLREFLLSIVFAAFFLISGLWVSDKISNKISETNQIYLHAIEIEEPNLFSYSISTEAGTAFVHGKLVALDPVTLDGQGPYLLIRKDTERHTMHTRVVTHSDGKRTWTTTETYWTWDNIKNENVYASKLKFCDTEIDYGEIDLPSKKYLCTIYDKQNSNLRYIYNIIPKENDGVLFTTFSEGSFSSGKWIECNSAKEGKNSLIASTDGWLIFFWTLWGVLGCGVIGTFIIVDNQWLDN